MTDHRCDPRRDLFKLAETSYSVSLRLSYESRNDAVQISRLAVLIIAALCFFDVAGELCAASANPSVTPAPTESLSIGGASIKVEIDPGDLSLSRTQVLDWIRRSACAVTEYYAGFPVRKVDVKIVPIDEGKGVLFGRTVLVDQTLVIRVGLSRFATDSSCETTG